MSHHVFSRITDCKSQLSWLFNSKPLLLMIGNYKLFSSLSRFQWKDRLTRNSQESERSITCNNDGGMQGRSISYANMLRGKKKLKKRQRIGWIFKEKLINFDASDNVFKDIDSRCAHNRISESSASEFGFRIYIWNFEFEFRYPKSL